MTIHQRNLHTVPKFQGGSFDSTITTAVERVVEFEALTRRGLHTPLPSNDNDWSSTSSYITIRLGNSIGGDVSIMARSSNYHLLVRNGLGAVLMLLGVVAMAASLIGTLVVGGSSAFALAFALGVTALWFGSLAYRPKKERNARYA